MGRSYGQFCPVAKAAELFCERWNALLFRELGAASTRFSEIQRGVPLMSPSMLSRRLKELEREGVIERCEDEGGITYHLTDPGREFLPLVYSLGTWGQRWTRRELAEGEIDYGLLLWDMERTVRGDAFGDGRTVVQLTFADLPAKQANWWFVNEGKVELCVHDPGFEVDLYLSVSVPDMIHVWRGDVSVDRAVERELLKPHGPKRLVRRLRKWLNPSPLTEVRPARETAPPG
jgi:DNA-binding HxlR family transcriptional regulator